MKTSKGLYLKKNGSKLKIAQSIGMLLMSHPVRLFALKSHHCFPMVCGLKNDRYRYPASRGTPYDTWSCDV